MWEGEGGAAEGVQLPHGGGALFWDGVQDDGAALCSGDGGGCHLLKYYY